MLTTNRILSHLVPWEAWKPLYWDLTDAWPTRQVISGAPLNLWIREEEATVWVELPGRQPDDIQVSVHRNLVSIAVDRCDAESPAGGTCVREERRRAPVSRQVQLPFEVDTDRIEATYKNGLLQLTLHRLQSTLPSRIAVKAG